MAWRVNQLHVHDTDSLRSNDDATTEPAERSEGDVGPEWI